MFKPTLTHSNADGLSRLPLPMTEATKEAPEEVSVFNVSQDHALPVTFQQVQTAPEEVSVFNVSQDHALPVTFQQVQTATRRDPLLSKVSHYVKNGWPDQISDELKPYKNREQEIGIESGCLMWGIRVTVPKSLQEKVLESLHENHPGITRIKAVARSYLWWSGLDAEIEEKAKSCLQCQETKSTPAVAPLHPWIWPTTPWKRIHIDFAGSFLGKM